MTIWTRYRRDDGRIGFGTLEGGRISEYRGNMFGDDAAPTGETIQRGSVRLLAPCNPGKVIALWNNFRALGAKLGVPPPAHPLFLIKPSSSLAGPEEPIVRPAGYAGKIAFEGELAIVIGRACRNVPVERAAEHIFGFTCINDVTAAELLHEDKHFPQWCRAKGFDTFSCLGPVIATRLDWSSARVVTTLADTERQNYPLSDMIFTPEEQVSRLSYGMTLSPGDVIACGTSVGVGSIPDGATVRVSIDGIGTLSNVLRSSSS
jgi:2-keto-4-pentenoate hydratase/2-oxohepta-3-ene-1,7-dioic acid hydratase in catechol pathway